MVDGPQLGAPINFPSPGSNLVRVTAQTVQGLEAFTSASVLPGQLGIVLATGRTWRALTSTVLGSTWEPTTGFFGFRDFGALGDNVTNDTVACQAAIDAAEQYRIAFGGGGVVFVDPGDYRITASLDLRGEVTLRGAGRLVSRIRTSLGIAVLDGLGPLVEAEVRELGIEGGGAGVAGGIGILLDNIDRFILEDLDIRSIQTGILVTNGCQNSRIQNVFGTSFLDGIVVEDQSSATQIIGCRINAASADMYRLDGVSQCNIIACEAEGFGAGSVGIHVAETALSTICNNLIGNRTEGPGALGTGVLIDAGVQYTEVIAPYWTGLANSIINNGDDSFVNNRARLWNPLIAADPEQAPGDALLRLTLDLDASFNTVEFLSHDIATAADGDPIILRRQFSEMKCGSNNGVTLATAHFAAWQGETGGLTIAGLRSQKRMPFAGRILSVGIISSLDLGLTTLGLHIDGAAVASFTSGPLAVGAGPAAGNTFVFSTPGQTGVQHWGNDQRISLSYTPANTQVNPVIVCEIAAEIYLR